MQIRNSLYDSYQVQSRGWNCSCNDYVCSVVKSKHVYAVEIYRRQNTTISARYKLCQTRVPETAAEEYISSNVESKPP